MRASARPSGSQLLRWSNTLHEWGHAEHDTCHAEYDTCAGRGCLGVCGHLGAAVGTCGLRRADPARQVSRGACGHVYPVSYAAHCPGSTRPHTPVPGCSHPHPHPFFAMQAPADAQPSPRKHSAMVRQKLGKNLTLKVNSPTNASSSNNKTTYAPISHDPGRRCRGGGVSQVATVRMVGETRPRSAGHWSASG